MLKYGMISQIDYSKGLARVIFDEQDMISGWLGLPCSMQEVRNWPTNAQVAVLMHEDGENGEILHRRITDEESAPSFSKNGVEGYKFSDGVAVYYDKSTGKMTIDATGKELIFNCTKLTVSGDVVAGINKISLTTHTHTTPVGPSGTPIPTP